MDLGGKVKQKQTLTIANNDTKNATMAMEIATTARLRLLGLVTKSISKSNNRDVHKYIVTEETRECTEEYVW